MMNTPHLIDLLFPYVYGELSEHDAQRVRDHCATCATCAAELELTRATHGLLTRYVPAQPQPFFWTRLAARLDAEGLQLRAPWQEWVWVAKRLIPALIAATLIITSLFSRSWDESKTNIETYLIGNGTTETGEQVLVDTQDISKETVFQSAVLQSVALSE